MKTSDMILEMISAIQFDKESASQIDDELVAELSSLESEAFEMFSLAMLSEDF